MNQNDINAAHRLIAQFQGKAIGRHNSNEWNRDVQEGMRSIHAMMNAPIPSGERQYLTFKEHLNDQQQ